MPELGEQMYCSQQICIPPTFPYLLRQFAKAAIRTQPNDLLKWSTAYFRCLSLNIPPPVKPRLEYPIPRDYHGVTPGWLRALLRQLQSHDTVTFKVLWDRWIGACLQHHTLIQILVLGGFTDNQAVPWLRFVALCAAHLTDNLTQTMILICEILTEEPEGGSAMIPASVFIDLYRFLAAIEASYPQTLRNYFFLDKFLELYQEKIARDEGPKEIKEEVVEKPPSFISSESSEEEEEKRKVDDGSVVSCPSVTSQDPDNFLRLMAKLDEEIDGEEMEGEMEEEKSTSETPEEEVKEEEEPEEGDEAAAASLATGAGVIENEEKASVAGDQPPPAETTEETEATAPAEDANIPEGAKEDASVKEPSIMGSPKGSVHGSVAQEDASIAGEAPAPVEEKPAQEEEVYLKKMAAEHEDHGEGDESFNAGIKSQVSFGGRVLLGEEEGEREFVELEGDEYEIIEGSKSPPYEDVFVEAIPGIGGIVPEDLVEAVCAHLRKIAALQHNMVMPRNIRHYECPPLHPFVD